MNNIIVATTANNNKAQLHTAFLNDRRNKDDRRFSSTRALNRHSLTGQRAHARRLDDKQNNGYYIDRYDSKIIITLVSILLLCLADAAMTILILSHGGQELNIIMELLIKESIFLFIIGKYLLTSGGLIFLVAHRHFTFLGKVKVSHMLLSLLIGYSLLISYEITLLYAGKMLPIF